MEGEIITIERFTPSKTGYRRLYAVLLKYLPPEKVKEVTNSINKEIYKLFEGNDFYTIKLIREDNKLVLKEIEVYELKLKSKVELNKKLI